MHHLAHLQELADPGTAPKLELTPGGAPCLVYGGASSSDVGPAAAALPSSSSSSRSSSSTAVANGPQQGQHAQQPKGMREARTRVWGHVALAKRGQKAPRTYRNEFVRFAMRWTTALLREVGACVTVRVRGGGGVLCLCFA